MLIISLFGLITIMGATLPLPILGENGELFNFMTVDNVDNWTESSDTVREPGMSKAVMSLEKTKLFQRAVFFTLLNPQPNGAGFAGVRTRTAWDLSAFKSLLIRCRGQGENNRYKIVLKHKGHNDTAPSYEQFFMAPAEFFNINLNLSNFQPYYRGKLHPEAEPLDTTNITMFGFQIFGGVYSDFKQKGVSALEIDSVTATL